MSRRLTDEETRPVMLAAGLDPLELYPGSKAKWKCKCINCGGTVYITYTEVRRPRRTGFGCTPCNNKLRGLTLRLTPDQLTAESKICSLCNSPMIRKFRKDGRSRGWTCQPCDNKKIYNYYRENPDRLRDAQLWVHHKVRLDKYTEILNRQDNSCASCTRQDVKLVIDHDHACCPGKRSCGNCVRGLLCSSCNIAAGMADNNPDRLEQLALYLETYKNGRDARRTDTN